jgi:hypothetical protein
LANQTHSTITDAEKHEPKGVETASENSVYTADGAGSGSWSRPFELVSFIDESSTGTDTTIELTGLTGYSHALLVVTYLRNTNTDRILLQVDNSGTYVTTGYEGGLFMSNDTGHDNEGSGLMVARSDKDNLCFTVWLHNLSSAGVVCMRSEGFCDNDDYLVSPTSGTARNVLGGAGRLASNATVTKVRFLEDAGGSFDSGAARIIHLYGFK